MYYTVTGPGSVVRSYHWCDRKKASLLFCDSSRHENRAGPFLWQDEGQCECKRGSKPSLPPAPFFHTWLSPLHCLWLNSGLPLAWEFPSLPRIIPAVSRTIPFVGWAGNHIREYTAFPGISSKPLPTDMAQSVALRRGWEKWSSRAPGYRNRLRGWLHWVGLCCSGNAFNWGLVWPSLLSLQNRLCPSASSSLPAIHATTNSPLICSFLEVRYGRLQVPVAVNSILIVFAYYFTLFAMISTGFRVVSLPYWGIITCL